MYNFYLEVIALLYRIYPQTEVLKFYREPYSGIKLPYRTVREMKKLYPDENFTIIGEIGGIAKPTKDSEYLFVDDDKIIAILPRGSLIKPFEWIAGYVEVEKDIYLAAIRSLIVMFYLT